MNTKVQPGQIQPQRTTLPKLYWAYRYRSGAIQVKQYRKGNDYVIQAAKKNAAVAAVIEPFIAMNAIEATKIAYGKFGQAVPRDALLRANGRTDLETVHSIQTQSLEMLMFPKASLARRAIARILDVVLMFMLPTLLYVIYQMRLDMPEDFVIYLGVGSSIFTLMYFLFGDAISSGQSLGKKILHIAVVDASSKQPCSYAQSIIRNSCLLLAIVDLFPMFARRRQRIGDRLAHTLVIQKIDFRNALIDKPDVIQVDA